MNAIDYQKQLDAIIAALQAEGIRPRLLLHACCAPCASYCLEYLTRYFDVTVFYYNPNIASAQEYETRLFAVKRLLAQYENVGLIAPQYRAREFADRVAGLEDQPEGGARCTVCYALRLQKTAEAANDGRYDYFASTLSISPHKDARRLNEIGASLARQGGAAYLPNDFKKRGGFQRSIVLSKQLGLYRQDYCGCEFSRLQRERQSQFSRSDGR